MDKQGDTAWVTSGALVGMDAAYLADVVVLSDKPVTSDTAITTEHNYNAPTTGRGMLRTQQLQERMPAEHPSVVEIKMDNQSSSGKSHSAKHPSVAKRQSVRRPTIAKSQSIKHSSLVRSQSVERPSATESQSVKCPSLQKSQSIEHPFEVDVSSSPSGFDVSSLPRSTRHCPICGKSFRAFNLLALHIRTHTGEKPHKCPQCGRGFAQISNLNKHVVSHEPERRFRCPVCLHTSKLPYDLRAHIRVVHKLNPKQFTLDQLKNVPQFPRSIKGLKKW